MHLDMMDDQNREIAESIYKMCFYSIRFVIVKSVFFRYRYTV